jgi:hypothetical protein
MTEGGGFPLGSRGDDVPNLHLVVGDDDAIDDPCYQLSALGKREVVQGRLHFPAKRFESLRQGGNIHLLLRLRLELAQLLDPAVLNVDHLLSFGLKLITPDALAQLERQPARLLEVEPGESIAQGLPPGLQGLEQPGPIAGTRQFMGDERWRSQDPAQLLPDQGVQGSGRGHASLAAVAPGGPPDIASTATAIVGIIRGDRAPRTRQLTLATSDQVAEQVFVRSVVPAGHLGVALHPGLGRRKRLRADEGRHRDGNPGFGRGRPRPAPRPHRAQGGVADVGGH